MLAGLTTLHLDRRGILRLASNEAYALAADFAHTFSDSPFRLIALPSGDFLLWGPASGGEQAFEPARLVGGGVAEAQPLMARRSALRSLGAEIEMWLHEHPLNQARRQRGEPPVTGLWFWGGGPWPTTMAAAAINAASVVTYGRDAVLEGLASISKHTSAAVPAELHDLFGEPGEARTVLVLEIGALMFANAGWTLREAVTNIDARYLAPAVGFLRQRKLRTMHLLANDYHFLLRPSDLLKFWHRSQPGLTGLT